MSVVRKMQIKTIMRDHLTPIRMAAITDTNTKEASVGKDVKLEAVVLLV